MKIKSAKNDGKSTLPTKSHENERRGGEEVDMDLVIERLRQEKAEAEKKHYEQGKKDGFEWVRKATYKELQYALRHVPMAEEEELIDYEPLEDSALGEYFYGIMEQYDDMDMEETTLGHYKPNSFFEAWEKGWCEAVRRFWDGIKSKL